VSIPPTILGTLRFCRSRRRFDRLRAVRVRVRDDGTVPNGELIEYGHQHLTNATSTA
jgi:hypothetical protein